MMLRVWDVDKEVCVRVLEGHQGTVRTLQALPEGFLASGSADKSIRLWHVHSGALVHTIHDAHAKVRAHRHFPWLVHYE
jgi:WD40 repeat protein